MPRAPLTAEHVRGGGIQVEVGPMMTQQLVQALYEATLRSRAHWIGKGSPEQCDHQEPLGIRSEEVGSGLRGLDPGGARLGAQGLAAN